MNTNTIQVIDNGLRCLSENLGTKETEIFISTILREKFDYTQWRQSFIDKIRRFEDLEVLDATKENEYFHGNADIVL